MRYWILTLIIMSQSMIVLAKDDPDAPLTVRGHQYQKSLKDLNAKIARNPRDAEALHLRAAWYLDNLEFANAVKDETEALKIKETVESLEVRAEAHLQLNQFSESLKDRTRITILRPEPKSYHRRAQCYKALNEIDKALADMNMAIKLDSNYAGNFEERAVLFRMKKDYINAIKDMKKAIALSSPSWNRCIYLGNIQMDACDFKGAIASYDLALKADPRLLRGIYGKAKACEAAGMKAEAATLYKRAKQIENEEIGTFR